jgi:hypothetical protein
MKIEMLDEMGEVTETSPAEVAYGVCDNAEDRECPTRGRSTKVIRFTTGSEIRWQLCRECIDTDDYCRVGGTR